MLMQACWTTRLDLGIGCPDPAACAAPARSAVLEKEAAGRGERHFREMYACARAGHAGTLKEFAALQKEIEGARKQAVVPAALLVSFEHTRSAVVLEEAFGRLRGKTGVVDVYGPYKKFFLHIQRDWIRVVRHAEEARISLSKAAEGDARAAACAARDRAFEAYLDLIALRRAAQASALAPFTMRGFVLETRRLAGMFDRKFGTELYNAAPDLFTFVWQRGVPDNTARAEVAMRDSVVRQRNARHQLVNKEGMARFSAQVSFNHTCELNGV